MNLVRTASKRFASIPHFAKWFLCVLINLCIVGYFVTGLVAPASTIKSAWLPGETTHGHYQIELKCSACHDPTSEPGDMSASDVMQDACIRCHGEQLEIADDTHPASKFRDPTNAVLLQTLNAQDCLTCHQEHLPERTSEMGVSLPVDYCWHCHEDVGDSRPSHVGMSHDSCATAGCHNYHDNRALYEKFLDSHYGEPDFIDGGSVPPRQTIATLKGSLAKSIRTSPDDWLALGPKDADAPKTAMTDDKLMADWAETAHAAAGVNCGHCHAQKTNDAKESVSDDDPGTDAAWSNTVSLKTCGQCHQQQTDSFLTGKHGMRLGSGLSPMTPSLARLPMHSGAAHRQLDCNACHQGHRFDTGFAAAQACLQCHADDHSLAYADTAHAAAWANEQSGDAPAGTGVSCATCHLPRIEGELGTWVNHDQNAGLRPNETMARQVCLNCHGLEMSLSSLADPHSKATCYGQAPDERTESVQMAHDWFVSRAAKAEARKAKQRARKESRKK